MSSTARRIPSLDGLRALAILMVIYGHLTGTPGFPWFVRGDYPRFGVRIFFVISGFLITTLLLNEREKTGTISLRDFYVRRAYRIFPAASVFLVVVSIVYSRLVTIPDFLASFFYAVNYYSRSPVLGHMWSLSVEEQFYMLWPVLLLFCFRKRFTILLVGIALAPILRGIVSAIDFKAALLWFPCIQDALAIGCLLAVLGPKLDRIRPTIDRWIIPIAIVTLAMPAFTYPPGVQPIAILSLMNIGIALCVDHLIRHPYAFFNNPPIEWVGRLSYSLYLWQEPFVIHQIKGWWMNFPVNILCAFACACGSHYLVEKPFLALRERRKAAKRMHQQATAEAELATGTS